MIPQKRVISPSLILDAVQTDRFKTETLSVSIVTPMSRELTPLYVLALSTLKRGTEKFPSQKLINKRLDELYATGISIRLDRYGSTNLLGFCAELLGEEYTDGKTDIFDGALDVILQMLFHPLLDEKGHFLARYVESEKDNVCDAIEAQINNPRAYASKRCREIMFEKDDYGAELLGTVEQIRGVTAEALSSAYRDLISDHTFRVFYIGSKSIDEVEKRIKKRILSYLSDAIPERGSTTECSAIIKKIKRVDEEMSLSQGKLVLGFRTGVNVCHGDFYPMLVLSEIYGGSPVSKLFMNVRERLGLCYYCSASYDIYKGVMFVSSGVDPASREMAEMEILHQLDDIRCGKITKGEFDAAVKSLVSSYRAISDLPSTLESFYAGRELFGVCCTVSEFMESVGKVTVEDVIRVADKIALDTVYFLYGNENAEGEVEDEFSDFT